MSVGAASASAEIDLGPPQSALSEDQLAINVVLAMHRLAKQSTLYTTENEAQVRQLQATQQAFAEYGRRTGRNAKIYFTDKSVFVGRRLLRAGRSVYAAARELAAILCPFGIDEMAIGYDVPIEELKRLQASLAEALRRGGRSPRDDKYTRIRLRKGHPPGDRPGRQDHELPAHELVIRNYCTAIVVMRRFLQAVQRGRYAIPANVRRIAQQLADLSALESPVFLGTTALYNARHEHAGRAVNAAMLALGMAHHITDEPRTLSRIAMAALLYDVGLPRVAGAGPTGEDRVGVIMPNIGIEQERELPAATATVTTALGGLGDAGMMQTSVVYEALYLNLRHDRGEPYGGAHTPSLEARIVAAARRFTELLADTAAERTADQAVSVILREARQEADRTAARLLMAALGLFATGALVELSTGHVAQVIHAWPDPIRFSTPIVRLVVDASAGQIRDSQPIDLSRETAVYATRLVAVGDEAELGAPVGQGEQPQQTDEAPPLDDEALEPDDQEATPPRDMLAAAAPVASEPGLEAPDALARDYAYQADGWGRAKPRVLEPSDRRPPPAFAAAAVVPDDGLDFELPAEVEQLAPLGADPASEPTPDGESRLGEDLSWSSAPAASEPVASAGQPRILTAPDRALARLARDAMPNAEQVESRLDALFDDSQAAAPSGPGLAGDAAPPPQAVLAPRPPAKPPPPEYDDAETAIFGQGQARDLAAFVPAAPVPPEPPRPEPSPPQLPPRQPPLRQPEAPPPAAVPFASPVAPRRERSVTPTLRQPVGTPAPTADAGSVAPRRERSLTPTQRPVGDGGGFDAAGQAGSPASVRRQQSTADWLQRQLVGLKPAAQGALDKTPLVHLLVYALDQNLTGTTVLLAPGGSANAIYFRHGVPAKARVPGGAEPLDRVLLDLGVADGQSLQVSLGVIARTGELHGEHLVSAGMIDVETLYAALSWQLARKVSHMLRLPPDSRYAFYAGQNLLAEYGGPELTPCDPLPLIMIGVRLLAGAPLIDQTLMRLGDLPLRLHPLGDVSRLALQPDELEVIDRIEASPATLAQLIASSPCSPDLTKALVYALAIARFLHVGGQAKPPVGLEVDLAVCYEDGSAVLPPARASDARQQVVRSSTIGMGSSNVGAEVAPTDGPAAPPPSPTAQAPAAAEPSGPAEPTGSSLEPLATARKPLPRRGSATGSSLPRRGTSSAHALPRRGSASTRGLPRRGTSTGRSSGELPGPAASASVPTARDGAARGLAGQAAAPLPRRQHTTGAPARAGPSREEIGQRVAQLDQQSLFDVLGVDEQATVETIQSTYFKLAKSWHPDRLPPDLGDLKGDVARVFARINAAYQTLSDPTKRQQYLGSVRAGGGTSRDRELLDRAVDSALLFQKAEVMFKKGHLGNAEALVQQAVAADPGQPEYRTLLAWIQAQRMGNPPTLAEGQRSSQYAAQIQQLDEVLAAEPEYERALFYRAELLKRAGFEERAIRDYRKVVALNPRNIDAAREVRIYDRRHPQQKPGGLLGKLFGKPNE